MAIEKIINIKVQETGLDDLNKDLAKTSSALKDVDTNAEKLNSDLGKSEFKTFKTQLKEANAELQKMSSLFGETSVEAVNAAKNVAKIKDEMEFQKELIKSYNPDEKFRALSQTAGIATLALGGLKDAFSGLGIESETLDKIINAAQGLLGATSAVSGLADAYALLRTKKVATAVSTEALAAAQLTEAGASGVATTAAGALATAEGLALLPITAIVAGIALLVGGIYYFRDSIAALLPNLDGFTSFMKDAYNAVTDFIGVTSDATREFDRVSEAAKKSSELNTKFLAEEGDQINKYTKAKIDAKQRYNEAVQKDGANQVAFAKRLNRELLAIDKEHEADLKKSRDDAAEKQAAANKKIEEDRKAKEAQKAKEALDARVKAAEEAKAQNDDFIATVSSVNEYTKGLAADKEKANEKEAESSAFVYETGRALKDKEKKDDDAAVAAKKANQDQLVNQGSQLLANIQVLAGKNKAIQKAAIITDSGISLGKVGVNTAEAITKDLAKGFPISVALVALDAAVGITSAAAIISNTNKALQAVGGGSAPSAPNITAPTLSAPSFNLAQGTTQGAVVAGQQAANQPIKAYVVGSDVTTQQQLDLKTQTTATFG